MELRIFLLKKQKQKNSRTEKMSEKDEMIVWVLVVGRSSDRIIGNPSEKLEFTIQHERH